MIKNYMWTRNHVKMNHVKFLNKGKCINIKKVKWNHMKMNHMEILNKGKRIKIKTWK